LALYLLEVLGGAPEARGETRTHPKAAERIVTALDHPVFGDNDQTIDFAVVSLAMHLQALGINADFEAHDTVRGDLAALCIAAAQAPAPH
jgi:hypothetical protein